MARRRMIDPEIWSDPDFQELPIAVRLLFIAHFSLADDEGRGETDPRRWKTKVFPLDAQFINEEGQPEILTVSHVDQMIQRLAKPRGKRPPMVDVYEGPDGEQIYSMPRWRRHQAVPHPKPSIYPPPRPAPGRDPEKEKRSRGRPGKPASESQIGLLKALCLERGLDLDAFLTENHYTVGSLLSREIGLLVQRLQSVPKRGPMKPGEAFAYEVLSLHKKGDYEAIKLMMGFPPPKTDWAIARNIILGKLGFPLDNLTHKEVTELITGGKQNAVENPKDR